MNQTTKFKYLHAKYSYFRYHKIPREVLNGFKKEQNFRKGLLFALLATVVVTILNIVISIYLDRVFAINILITGHAIGHAMRYFGKGITYEFGLTSSLFAIVSLITSFYLSVILDISREYNLNFIESFTTHTFKENISFIFEQMRWLQIVLILLIPFDAFKNSFRVLHKTELMGQNSKDTIGAEDLLDS